MTFLGNHTISEIADLANAATWRIQRIGDAIEKHRAVIEAKDPTLLADYDAWVRKWTPTRLTVQIALHAARTANAFLGPDVLTNEPLWLTVERVVQPVPYGPKDLAGLQHRTEDAIKPSAIEWGERPKLSAWDLDMGALRSTNEMKREGGEAIEVVKREAQGFLDQNAGKIVLGIGGGIVALALLKKWKVL
jgi:hypothetical protein